MKKLLKTMGIAALFAAVFGFTFVGCSNGSSGSTDTETDTGGGTGGNTGGGSGITDSYTYHWKFTNVTAASKTDVYQEISAEEVTPEGAYDLKLSLSGYFNLVDSTKTVGSSSQTAIYGKASVGAVEVAGDTTEAVNGSKGLVSLELKGPFKATMYASTNSSSDKTDRYARIMVGDTEYCNESEKTANATGGKLPAAGTTVVAAGSRDRPRCREIRRN